MYARRVENASAAEAEGSRWSATIKAHEVVLRRVAARQGLRLERSAAAIRGRWALERIELSTVR